MRVALKFVALAFLGASSNAYAHELRGATAVTDVVPADGKEPANPSDVQEMDGEDRNNNKNRNRNNRNSSRSRSRSNRNNRNNRNNSRNDRRYTDKGKRRYRPSNSNDSGWKKSAAGKREDNRNRKRDNRNNRNCRNRNCLIEDLGLYPEDADLLADFFEDYEDEDVEFISDFLLDELDFDDYDGDYASEE